MLGERAAFFFFFDLKMFNIFYIPVLEQFQIYGRIEKTVQIPVCPGLFSLSLTSFLTVIHLL